MRAFLDTNVLVAAFATRGLCADVLRTTLAEHDLLLSRTVIEELRRVLIEKIRVPEPTVSEIAAFLLASASLPDGSPQPAPVVVRDPDDAVTLGEALAIGADVLVTGDKDLLEAGELSSTPGASGSSSAGSCPEGLTYESRTPDELRRRIGLRVLPQRYPDSWL